MLLFSTTSAFANDEPLRAILYESKWCPHCKATIEQLRKNGVRFVRRDIFDKRYSKEYVQKMRSLGQRPPSVPLVDLQGHLILGLDNTSIGWAARMLRKGKELKPQGRPGATSPPSPLKPAYPKGGQFTEPSTQRAIIYGSPWCDWCGPTRRFLKRKGLKFVQKNSHEPAVGKEVKAHLATFGRAGPTVPVIKLFDRIIIGFDKDSIHALLKWRRAQ